MLFVSTPSLWYFILAAQTDSGDVQNADLALLTQSPGPRCAGTREGFGLCHTLHPLGS